MGCRVLIGGNRHLRVLLSDYALTVMVLSLTVVLLTTRVSCVLVTDTLFKYFGQIKLLLLKERAPGGECERVWRGPRCLRVTPSRVGFMHLMMHAFPTGRDLIK